MSRKNKRRWPLKDHPNDCDDCKEWSGDYMLHHEVWRAAVPLKENSILLCLPCVQRRLGRPMRPADFDMTLPANCVVKFAIKMPRGRS